MMETHQGALVRESRMLSGCRGIGLFVGDMLNIVQANLQYSYIDFGR